MTDDPPGRRSRGEREASTDAESDARGDPTIPTDRESPVGAPVIRGDATVTGEHARRAVEFDPDDPDSLAAAADTVRRFATGDVDRDEHLYVLRGAAACAALVRGVGSYKDAAERAGDEVTVSFVRKWARVHDLPRSVRRHVALGRIAPTAAKHIARVSGEERLLLAWATLDGDLTVREVRTVASAINDGVAVDEALADHGVELGTIDVSLSPGTYRDLRRHASLAGVDPDAVVVDALEAYFDSE